MKFWGCENAISHWFTLIYYFISRFRKLLRFSSMLLTSFERIQLLTNCLNPQRRFVQPVLREISFQVLPMKWKSRLLSQVVLTQTPSRIVILKTPTFRCWFSTIEDWDTLQAFNKTRYSVNSTERCTTSPLYQFSNFKKLFHLL